MPTGAHARDLFDGVGCAQVQLPLVGLGQARVDLVNPAVQSDLVAFGDRPGAVRRDAAAPRRPARKTWRARSAFDSVEDARHADAAAVLAPGHAPDRLAAVAQLVGLVVAIEGQRNRAAGPARPALRFQRSPRAHLVDTPAPFVLRPLPRFHRSISWLLRFMLVTATRPAARDGKRPVARQRQPPAALARLPCSGQPRSGSGDGSGIRQAATGARAIRPGSAGRSTLSSSASTSFGTLSSRRRV